MSVLLQQGTDNTSAPENEITNAVVANEKLLGCTNLNEEQDKMIQQRAKHPPSTLRVSPMHEHLE